MEEDIEYFKNWVNTHKYKTRIERAGKILLNKLENQNKKIVNLTNIIDNMARDITETFVSDQICEFCIKNKIDDDEWFEVECQKDRTICIKQYYKDKFE